MPENQIFVCRYTHTKINILNITNSDVKKKYTDFFRLGVACHCELVRVDLTISKYIQTTVFT